MRLGTIRYGLVNGFKGLFENRLMTMASIGIIAACLFILGINYCVLINVQHNVSKVDEKLGIEVFFNKGTDEEKVLTLKDDISKKSEVKSITYISPEEAWREYKTMWNIKDDGSIYKENPLKDASSFEIYLYDAKDFDVFVRYLEAQTIVRQVNHPREIAATVENIGAFIQYTSLFLIGILLMIGIMLIANTIKVGIYVRRHEINIMKYLGAKDYFITFPFIIEGIFIGVLGGVLPYVVIQYSYDYVISLLSEEFATILAMIDFIPVGQLTSVLIPLFMIIGAGMGVVGSAVSIRRHLRV